MVTYFSEAHAPSEQIYADIANPTDGVASSAAYDRDLDVSVDQPQAQDFFADKLTDNMENLVPGPGKTDHTNGASFSALWVDTATPEFFENFHVVPRSFDFGFVLSTQTSPLEVHSGYRREFRTWSSFVNNAGAGTTLIGLPSLPATMDPLDGYLMTLEVSTTGAPTVDDDLAFVFDFGGTQINVPIKLNRVVLFPIRPEIPYSERLQFLTDVISHEDGGEQRIKLRKNPRSLFNWRTVMEDGVFDIQRFNTLLYDWQSRVWGLPIWHEATRLTSAASAGALTINVESTDNADYRVGGLALVFGDSGTFDVQTIASFTSNTITFENAILNGYTNRTAVAPLRAAHMRREVQANRAPSGLQTFQFSFRVLDNDSDLADTTGWPTYNGKILLDSCNVMRGNQISETSVREISTSDNATGLVFQDSPWDHSKRGYPLTLRANSPAEYWDLRQLMHHFGGQQVSFYVPTFTQDLSANQDLSMGSQDLNIVNIGYTQFVRQRPGRKHVWIRLNDGTTYTREITSSVEVDGTTETLVVDVAWPSTILVTDIDRISYLEEVRYNSDEITIDYVRGARRVYYAGPVITTFDDS